MSPSSIRSLMPLFLAVRPTFTEAFCVCVMTGKLQKNTDGQKVRISQWLLQHCYTNRIEWSPRRVETGETSGGRVCCVSYSRFSKPKSTLNKNQLVSFLVTSMARIAPSQRPAIRATTSTMSITIIQELVLERNMQGDPTFDEPRAMAQCSSVFDDRKFSIGELWKLCFVEKREFRTDIGHARFGSALTAPDTFVFFFHLPITKSTLPSCIAIMYGVGKSELTCQCTSVSFSPILAY